jgi:hypothetical protein
MSSTLKLIYSDFRKYFCEDWGENYFSEVFDTLVKDGQISIEWKYRDEQLIWRVDAPGNCQRAYRLLYAKNSPFELWWNTLNAPAENVRHE